MSKVSETHEETMALEIRQRVIAWNSEVMGEFDYGDHFDQGADTIKVIQDLADQAVKDVLGVSIVLGVDNINSKSGCKIPNSQYSSDQLISDINDRFKFLVALKEDEASNDNLPSM